jgi:hypothetical protein
MVSDHFKIPFDKLHGEKEDAEEDWKKVLKEITEQQIRNPHYHWPTAIGVDRHYNRHIALLNDLSATFTGPLGGNQVVFSNAPFRALKPNQVDPFTLLQAFYKTDKV